MSNICAGIGRGQMTILKEHIDHHKHVHALYEKAFSQIDGIELKNNHDADFDSNYWLSTILINKAITGVDYEDVRIALDAKGIETRPLWKPMHLQPVFANNPAYVDGTSERLFNQGLCIPSGPYVTNEDVAFVVESIKECIKK